MQVIKGVMVLSNSLTLDIIALSPESVRQADLEQNSSFGLFSVRPESHDASNMKGSFFFRKLYVTGCWMQKKIFFYFYF